MRLREHAACECDREGVECGLRAVHPASASLAGRVQASDDKIEALSSLLVVKKIRVLESELRRLRPQVGRLRVRSPNGRRAPAGQGDLGPVIGQVEPLERASVLHQAIESRRTTGKCILHPAGIRA